MRGPLLAIGLVALLVAGSRLPRDLFTYAVPFHHPPQFARQSRVFEMSFASRDHPIRWTSRNISAHAASFAFVVLFGP